MLEPRANRQGSLMAVAVRFRQKLRDALGRDSLEEDFTVSRRDRSLKSSPRGWQSRLLLPRIVQVNLRRPRLAVVGRLFYQLADVVLAEIEECHARFGGFTVAPDHVSGVDRFFPSNCPTISAGVPAVSTQYCVHFWVFGSKVLKLFPPYPGLVQFSKLRSRRECARCGLTLRCPLWRS